MYPSLQEIEDYLKNDGSKPFLLVEYCHSMGNGPGDFEDYFQMIHKDDRMCGGFVWEWCDHAIAHGTAENGKTRQMNELEQQQLNDYINSISFGVTVQDDGTVTPQ